MHIITKGRALIAGRVFAPGTVLDLPEAEAQPALEDGTAVPWPEPPAEEEAAPAPAGGDTLAGASTLDGSQTLV